MKILITHNDYGRHSGEETAVDLMGEMMRSYGHEISYFRPGTAQYQHGLINKIRIFLAGCYSGQGVRGMKKILGNERPDVINVHNLYPFISPAALFACKSAGIPVVMTVHNYRLACPTGLFLRNGRPCEYCLQRGDEWGCIRFNCEKDIFKSTGYALRNYVARKIGAYQKNVDRFVCLTAFQRSKLIEAGFKADKITVIPNGIPAPGRVTLVAGDYIAYAGRLSEEKGWDLLVEVAARQPSLRFAVAGLVQEEQRSNTMPPNIHFTGFLDQTGLTAFYRQAKFLVIPSRCYEGFPLVALEAMALGKPVIAPDHGGFPEIIGVGPEAPGYLFRPNDSENLEAAILSLWNDPVKVQTMGSLALQRIRTSYSSELVYRRWEELFRQITQTPIN